MTCTCTVSPNSDMPHILSFPFFTATLLLSLSRLHHLDQSVTITAPSVVIPADLDFGLTDLNLPPKKDPEKKHKNRTKINYSLLRFSQTVRKSWHRWAPKEAGEAETRWRFGRLHHTAVAVERDKRRGQDNDTALLHRGRKWTDWKAARDLKRQKIWKALLPRRRDGGIRRWKNKPVGSGEIKLDRRQHCLNGKWGGGGAEKGKWAAWEMAFISPGHGV